jgi:DNA helicase IV
VLAAIDPSLELPRSVRESGSAPWRLAVTPGEFPAAVADAAQRLAAQTGDGKLAVIVPAGRLGELGSAVSAAIPAAAVGENPDLESPVVVLSVKQAKGLEFDAVLIAEPAEIVAESPRGLSDLYVALTRATQRLGVLHTGTVPDALARLEPARLADVS